MRKTISALIAVTMMALLILAAGCNSSSTAAGQQSPPSANPEPMESPTSPPEAQPDPSALNSQAFQGNVILGRPTADSMTLSLLASANQEIYVEYGRSSGEYGQRTGVHSLLIDQPLEIEVANLEVDAQYYYRVCHRVPGEPDFSAGIESAFHTQRAPGSVFSFGIQGDSHPERLKSMFDPDLYMATMNNVKDSQPDSYLTLGDDFSIE